MGFKSDDNQEKIRAVYNEREHQAADLAAKKAEGEKEMRKHMEYYSNFKNLQQKWKIHDSDKLKVFISDSVIIRIRAPFGIRLSKKL